MNIQIVIEDNHATVLIDGKFAFSCSDFLEYAGDGTFKKEISFKGVDHLNHWIKNYNEE